MELHLRDCVKVFGNTLEAKQGTVYVPTTSGIEAMMSAGYQISKTTAAVDRVSARLRVASFARRWHFFVLALAALYGATLLTGRLLGLWQNFLTPLTLAIVPLGALLLALLFHRRPARAESARAIDKKLQSRDLFLTATMIESALGDYKPLVLRQAEEHAANVVAREVVGFRWQRGAANVAGAMAILAAALFLLPQLDPFGKEKERAKLAERAKKLNELQKATTARKELLAKQDVDAEHSEKVEAALTELKKALNEMKPNEKVQNQARLQQQQKELGELWRQTSEEKVKNAGNDSATMQKFGADGQKLSKWKEELEKGEATEMKRELETLRKKVDQLSKMEDSPEKEKLQQEVKKDLKAMSDFIAQNTSSQALKDSLKRASEQMDLSKLPGLSEQSLKAVGESLKLSEQEMAQLTQAVRDLNSLEDALKTIQQAKALNDADKLGGGQCKGGECDKCGGQGCAGVGDYAKLYEELMKGQQQGGGMGNEGQGKGGQAPENENAESGFKPEKSQSALTAGKTLLEWKTRGLGEKGEAKLDYARQVQNVKQGVSEAILAEQIPPGYHEGIQKYFDSLEGAAPKSILAPAK